MLDTSRPASRILTVLEMLQDRPGITGPQIANELEVSARTVRRYITTLQEMGVPVEPTTGRHGGYALRPGFRLPPMMFNADEALGLAIALLMSRPTRDAELPPGVESALTKIERVLPPELSRRIHSLREGVSLPSDDHLGPPSFPDPHVLAKLAQACLTRQRCWMRYSRLDGDESAREVDPYGIGAFFGRWYLYGWCHLRNDHRTFRIDRIRRADILPQTFEAPEEVDVIAAIEESLALSWTTWRIEIEVEASVSDVREYVPRSFAVVEEIGNGRSRVRASSNTLDWFVLRIAELPFPVRVIKPPEIRDAFRRCAERMLEIAERS